MGRLIKILAWLFAGLIALFALSAVAILVFFEPNDFREDIATAVRDSTGRELIIDGDISLDLFPQIAIEVGSTSIGNAPGFGGEPMARFERARLRVQLMPLLLRREIVVGTAEIESLTLNLQVDVRGTGNWEDLATEGEQASAEGEPQDPAPIDIAGLELNNATIRYRDAASGDTYVLSKASLSLGGISGTDVLSIDGLSIEGILDGVADIPSAFKIRTGGIEIQTTNQVISLQPLELTTFGVDISADVEPFSYAGDVEPSATISINTFSPRSLMRVFGVEPPETADPTALSSVTIDAHAAYTPVSIELTDLQIKMDGTAFSGALSVPLDSTGSYGFDLVADTIELDRYMEPTAESSSASAGESGLVEIPVDLVKSLHANGKLRVTKAIFAGLAFENVELGLSSAAGRMRLHPITADFYGGHYSGDVRVDVAAATPAVSLNEKIENVDMAGLAKAMFDQENITGTINGAFKLQARGNDTVQLQRNLSGDMSFELLNGTFEGIDIWYELRRARARIKGTEAPPAVLPPRTQFSTVSATGVVKNGVMRNDDFFAELPFMQLTGRGQIDLAAATVNYSLVARVLDRPEFLQDATDEELNEFTQAEIPLKISGSLASPSVKPDLEKLLRKRVEDEIKDKLKDKLKDLFKR